MARFKFIKSHIFIYKTDKPTKEGEVVDDKRDRGEGER